MRSFAQRLCLAAFACAIGGVTAGVVIACGGGDSSPTGAAGPADGSTSDSSAALDGGNATSEGGDGRDASADGPTTPTIIDVHGQVLDGYRRPLAGASVRIGGGSATSGADGAFAIAAVTTPYDVIAVAADKSIVVVVVGLSRPDPTVSAAVFPGPNASATVTGALPALVSGESATTYADPGVPADTTLAGDLETAPASSYHVVAHWPTAAPVSATFWLFVSSSNDITYGATSFRGFATTTSSVSPGVAATKDFGALTTTTSGSLAFAFTLPPGHSSGSLSALVRPSGSPARMTVNQYTGSSHDTTIAVPNLAGATYFASVTSPGSGGEVVRVRKTATLGDKVNLVLPDAPAAASPDDGASAIGAGAAFSWTGGSGASQLALDPAGATPDGPKIRVLTTLSSAKLPDLASLGVTLPAAQSYAWTVTSYPGHTSLDDAASADHPIDWACANASAFAEDDCANGASAKRSFVTP